MTKNDVLLFLAVPFLGGCFSYAPVEPSTVSPDMAVRVRLTEDASRRMEATRDPDAPIEGRVFEVTNNGLGLLPELSAGGSTEPVSFDFSDVRLVELRQISQRNTWIMVGAGMAGGALFLLSIDALPFGSSSGGGTGDFFFSLPIGR